MTPYTKEYAQGFLDQYENDPKFPAVLLEYWRAIVEGTLIDHYYEAFRHKKEDYKDDLPAEDVRYLIQPGEPLTQYKCQGNFIFGLINRLQAAVEDEIITDPVVIETVEQVCQHDFAYYNNGQFTTQAEIEMINGVLDQVLAHLGPKKAN